MVPTGLEPVTYRLGICRSILMSYETGKNINLCLKIVKLQSDLAV